MLTSAVFSALHVLGVALALGSIVSRGLGFHHVVKGDLTALRAVFMADNLWGLSAIVVIGSGLTRAFVGLEKGTNFYLHNGTFFVKMAVLAIVLALEMVPMVTLLRWRLQEARGIAVADDVLVKAAPLFRLGSAVQAGLLVLMVFAAALMARGAWMLG